MNEANEHAGCVAVPAIDVVGRCVAAISVVAPEHCRVKQNMEILVQKICAASKLSGRLGAH